MRSIVAGDGGMGRAVADALAGRGMAPLAILGMPDTAAGHAPERFSGAEVLFEFTVGDQVLVNVGAALDGGVRHFVIGTTNWADDRAAVGRGARPESEVRSQAMGSGVICESSLYVNHVGL